MFIKMEMVPALTGLMALLGKQTKNELQIIRNFD